MSVKNAKTRISKASGDDQELLNFTHSPLEKLKNCEYIDDCSEQEKSSSLIQNRIGEKTKRRLSVKELADYLGVAPKTIYGWIYKGLIEPERIGPRLIRFDLEKVEQWILRSKETL